MNCPRCRSDNPPDARFCLNCGAALALRCSNCQAELPAGARFCMYCGQAVHAQTPADDARLQRLAAATPPSLADKVRAASHLRGEQRYVTALFVDVVGSTSLARQLGVERWSVLMNGVRMGTFNKNSIKRGNTSTNGRGNHPSRCAFSNNYIEGN
jgi:hypothetical protein